MNQYKVEIYKYDEAGSVSSLVTTRYAEYPEEAMQICNEYENVYQTTFDEAGNQIQSSLKQYQIRLYVLCYKLCQDRAAFFNQFKA